MVLDLPARLTQLEASACLSQLQSQLVGVPAGTTVSINAGRLGAFDSSALAVLLALRRQAEAGGWGFQLAGAPQRLQGLASLYGIGAWLAS